MCVSESVEVHPPLPEHGLPDGRPPRHLPAPHLRARAVLPAAARPLRNRGIWRQIQIGVRRQTQVGRRRGRGILGGRGGRGALVLGVEARV